MNRLAVAEEGLVVDPRLQALEVEPARGLGRQRPARRTGRRFALVLVRPVALVAVAALAFAIFRAGVAVDNVELARAELLRNQAIAEIDQAFASGPTRIYTSQ